VLGSRPRHSSEGEAAFAGAVGHGRDPAVVAVAAPVEHHGVDARGPGALVLSPSRARRSGSIVDADTRV
jgi:hypothetical protein